MKAIFVSFLIIFPLYSIAAEGSYLSCTGRSGLAQKQDQIPLLSRTITENAGPEKGSIFVGTDKVAVEGIPWMTGEYKICENSDQLIVFTPTHSQSCDPGISDKVHNFGILNKVTGDIRYNYGELLFILKCRKATKVLE